MQLTPPTKNVFYVSVVLALVGIVSKFVGPLGGYAFWIVVVAYVVLFLGNTMKGV